MSRWFVLSLAVLFLASGTFACGGARDGKDGDGDTDIDADTDTDTDGEFPWRFSCKNATGSATCGDVEECALDCHWEEECVQGCMDRTSPESCILAQPMQEWMVCYVESTDSETGVCTAVCADPESAECYDCLSENCRRVSERENRDCWDDGCPPEGCP